MLGQPPRSTASRRPTARADGARRLRASIRASSRRHAAARGDLPARCCPDPSLLLRTAVRRAGRDDARGDEPRAARVWEERRQERSSRHPQPFPRPSCSPTRRRDDGAPGPHRPRAHDRLAPPAHDGARVRSAVQAASDEVTQPHLRAPVPVRDLPSRHNDYLVPAATLVGSLVAWRPRRCAFRIPRFVMRRRPPSSRRLGLALPLPRAHW